ncbi:cell division protein FtsA [Marinomonas sp. SBI22]|uniref:cell division protein FtsA n=1 Tax=unclassified Marinomonas TaxID=196814 RepID=UPI0007AF62E9|nr:MULTISPECIES: cell division protein FtsA [unclassified Marinomonas]KZM39088.1 cell division protein FtsA [Marinomonas sp. SBI22]KZM39872.1 cell division protein FtsA [Marinomonas sp. SBI8L]
MIVGLDVGTSKVVCLVGEMMADGRLEIVGIGSHAAKGMKRGAVINIESTVQSIQRAVEEAELMAGCNIHSVYVSVAGSHIRSLNSHGIVAVKDGEVQEADIERVIDAAQAVPIPSDQRVLHILPQEYSIDSQEGIKDPSGMSGVRLEANVHLISGAANAVMNIEKCIKRCGLGVDGVILSQLASSHSSLSDDEKELGVCLVDIGAGTADMAVWIDGSIHHTSVVPVAGDQVTNDISMALRTPTQHAESIKIQYACALSSLAGADQNIEVPSVGDRQSRSISRHALAEVVEARYEEIFSLVLDELRRSGYAERIPAGIVVTGGTSLMEGATELAERVFDMPVRMSVPVSVKGMSDIVDNPIFSTGVGLIMYGIDESDLGIAQQHASSLKVEESRQSVVTESTADVANKMWRNMKSWVKSNF